jgi:hypothetical protein
VAPGRAGTHLSARTSVEERCPAVPSPA